MNAKELKLTLRTLKKATLKNHSPILATVLIDGSDYTTTDLTNFITMEIPDSPPLEKPVCVPLESLLSLVFRAPAEERVHYVLDDQNLVVIVGATTATIPIMDASEFPASPEMNPNSSKEVSADELQSALQYCLPAVSKDAARQQLRCIVGRAGKLFASDGKQLAEYSLDIGEAMIPTETAKIAISALKGQDSARVAIDKDTMTGLFSAPGMKLFFRQVHGQFPDYQNLIPEKFSTSATMTAKNALIAIKAVPPKLDSDGKNPTVGLSFGDGLLTVRTEHGFSDVNSTVFGPPTEILFSQKMLENLLKAFKNDDIEIGVSGPKGVAVASARKKRWALMPVFIPKRDN